MRTRFGVWKIILPLVRAASHRRITRNELDAVNPAEAGTKACAWYQLDLAPGETQIVRMRLAECSQPSTLVHDIDGIFARRIAEADEFYSFCPSFLSEDGKRVQRQAFAGLLWSKQYYHFVVNDWLKGD